MHGRQRCDEILRLIDEALAANDVAARVSSPRHPSEPVGAARR
jgi:hypothetical protein